MNAETPGDSADHIPWYHRPTIHFAIASLNLPFLFMYMYQFQGRMPLPFMNAFLEYMLNRMFFMIAIVSAGFPFASLLFGNRAASGPAYAKVHMSIASRVPVFGFLFPGSWMSLRAVGLIGATLGMILCIWIVIGFFGLLFVVSGFQDQLGKILIAYAGLGCTGVVAIIFLARTLVVLFQAQQLPK